MAVSLGQFGRRMQGAAKRLPSAVNVVVKELARDVHRGVVLETPVDEGDARSNWVVSLTSPQGTFISAYAPGKFLGKSERANANAAIAQGNTLIGIRLPGQTIFIQNNTPYIGILNDGYSRQSPALFVETAIITAIRNLNGKDVKVI